MTAKGIMASMNERASMNEELFEGDQLNSTDILDNTVEPRARRRRGSRTGNAMKRQVYQVDLSKLKGEGDFPCPRCGVIISPDDESEETYTILETKGEDEESVEEVRIQCKRCSSIVELKGFDTLKQDEPASASRFEISEPQEGSKPGFRTIHTISLYDKLIGRAVIEYLQPEDVKAFTKINRSLKAGDPFQARIFIDSSPGTSAQELGSKGLAEVVKALKKPAKGVRDRDIFIVSVEGGREKLMGRAESIVQEAEQPPA
jgi:hypothetical protein